MIDEHTKKLIKETNKLIAERCTKLSVIREKRNAFPNDFRRSAYAEDLQLKFGSFEKSDLKNKKCDRT